MKSHHTCDRHGASCRQGVAKRSSASMPTLRHNFILTNPLARLKVFLSVATPAEPRCEKQKKLYFVCKF